MNTFLRQAKIHSRSLSPSSRIHVVLGNEACDLDSAVCAISHAFHLSKKHQDSDNPIIFIPVLNVARGEIPLRTEITHLLPACQISLTDLVCRDEIDLESLNNLTLTLVDHNVLPKIDAALDRYVTEVIDHHVNSRHDDPSRDISVTVQTVGSCSTLVARLLLEQTPGILDSNLVKLLLGTILLDTVNMSESAGRKTSTDVEMVEKLRSVCPDLDHDQLFNEIQTAKFDISDLTTAQMLRKDFKSASSLTVKIGISSITLPLQDVLEQDDLEIYLKEFCEERNLDMNLVMTIDLEGSRQLAIYSEDHNLRESVEQRLQNSFLELERIECSVSSVSAFNQKNRKASRKAVMPLVDDFLRTLDISNGHADGEESDCAEGSDDLSSNVNNANDADVDRQPDGEAEAMDAASRILPMSPFEKRCISIDESVTKSIGGEWDENQVIIDAIRAKQEADESTAKYDRSKRQMSLATEEAMTRMQGVKIEEEWQDDEYSRHSLHGKNDPKKDEAHPEQEESFYKRPVPKDERESGDGAEEIAPLRSPRQIGGGVVTANGVVLREKKLTRPTTLLNRLSVQSTNSIISEGSIDLDNISDDEEGDVEPDETSSRKSASSKTGIPQGARPKEKKKIRPELSLNLDETITSQATEGDMPAVLTPTSTEMSWEDDTPMRKNDAEPIKEYTAREEHEDRWRWRKVTLAGKDYTIDMKAINPYKKVLSHGGYYGDGLNAIIVFASCYMPEKSRKDYTYIMNNLFLYVVSTLELLVAQEYIIIYFHGSASRSKIPGIGWMRKCYQMIDRKLRKSLKGLYLVHPTTWLKAVVQLTKPFVSHKFSNKLKFVKTLGELKTMVPMEYVYIPEEVKRFDQNKNKGG